MVAISYLLQLAEELAAPPERAGVPFRSQSKKIFRIGLLPSSWLYHNKTLLLLMFKGAPLAPQHPGRYSRRLPRAGA
jgi:hypothetical protein